MAVKRTKKAIIVLLALACAAIVLVGVLKPEAPKGFAEGEEFSVVLYGKSSERWLSFDQGMRQACNELGIPKPVIVLADTSGMEEQARLLQREIGNGTKGILVAAADSASLEGFWGDEKPKVPVVFVETGAGENHDVVCADNAGMGRELAQRIKADGVKEIYLLENNMQRQSVRERYNAFYEEAVQIGLEVAVRITGGSSTAVAIFAGQATHGALVAMDNETLEMAAEEIVPKSGTKLYGVGSSDKVVHFLDTGRIDGVCFENEFTIGYTATMLLAKQMGIKNVQVPEGAIEYKYVHRKNIYTPEIERVLFPIAQ